MDKATPNAAVEKTKFEMLSGGRLGWEGKLLAIKNETKYQGNLKDR